MMTLSACQIEDEKFIECSSVVVEYRTRNREVAGSTHIRSTASNLEQVANLLSAQAHSASAKREVSSSYGYGVKA